MTLSKTDIQKLIPHRDPFLFVDEIESLVPGESAVGIYHVNPEAWYFKGHFPGHPIMPGVLIIEALAQTAGVLASAFLAEQSAGQTVYFMSIEEARFRRPVMPGDTIKLHVTKHHSRGAVWKCIGQAYVGEHRVAEGRLTAMIRPITTTLESA